MKASALALMTVIPNHFHPPGYTPHLVEVDEPKVTAVTEVHYPSQKTVITVTKQTASVCTTKVVVSCEDQPDALSLEVD